MKKLLILSTVLLGAVSASQAGVSVRTGVSLPIPLPPPVIVSHSATFVLPPPSVYLPASRIVFAPPPWGVAPPPVVFSAPHVFYPYRHGHFVRRGWGRFYGCP